MSTAAAEAAPDTDTPFRFLPLAALKPSPLNPRKHFDEAKLEELAATMGNGVGVIEPLVVRDAKGGSFEIVAGERRWRAATIAALEEVPVVVKALTDAQVLEIMVIENDQREDINPLEEGDGFKRLMTFGFDIDKLATRIGRSRKYIYDRIKLLDLVDDGKALLLNGRISAGHAIIIARLLPGQQKDVLKVSSNGFGRIDGPLFEREDTLFTPDEEKRHNAARKMDRLEGLKVKSVRELQAWIDEHCHFDPTAPVNVELFPETAATVQDARKVIPITYAHHVHPDAKDGDKRIYTVVSWKRADKRACEHAVTGMVVAGAGRGEAFEVCINKDKCKVHWPEEVKRREQRAKKAAAAPRPPAADPKTKQKEADQARARQAKEQAAQRRVAYEEKLRAAALRAAITAAVEKFGDAPPKSVLARAIQEIANGDLDADGFEARFGIALPNYSYNTKVIKDLETLSVSELVKALGWAVISASTMYGRHDEHGKILSAFHVNLSDIEASVRAAGIRGTCKYCGCDDDHACEGGCSWVDAGQTLCSTASCVESHEGGVQTSAKSKAKAKPARAKKKP